MPNLISLEFDMTDAIRPLIAGNWKMNGLTASIAEFDVMLKRAAEVGWRQSCQNPAKWAP